MPGIQHGAIEPRAAGSGSNNANHSTCFMMEGGLFLNILISLWPNYSQNAFCAFKQIDRNADFWNFSLTKKATNHFTPLLSTHFKISQSAAA